MTSPISFGRYQLLDRLAAGGMADIFLAKATGEAGFEKLCVIKRVLPHLAQAPGFVEMFLDEARIAARLNHPGIVQIFDLGRAGEDYYLAMELLLGEDLHAVLSRCAARSELMPVMFAAHVVAQAAQALHFAHELADDAGRPLLIVHRDVSPANVFVTYQGTIKILDFGIARAAVRQGQTLAGHVKGKLAYMAPEQAANHPVDRRADVWSLGVVLYETLTLRRPFVGASTGELLSALRDRTPPAPRELRADVPLALEEIILKALERDVSRRYQTAWELAGALDGFISAQASGAIATGLAEFMLRLFGPEHIRAKQVRAQAPAQVKGATEEISAEGPPTTVVGPPVDTSPVESRGRRIRRGAFLAAAAVAAALLIAFGLALSRRAPHQAAPAPAVVAREVPAARDATPPAVVSPEAPAPLTPAPLAQAEPVKHADPAPRSWLSLASNLPATAMLDGSRLGGVPLNHVRVSPGEHELVLENRAVGARHVERITIPAHGDVVKRISFGKGQLNIIADPWADVWLDGASVGQTPLALKDIWEGSHLVRMVFPQGAKSRKVELAPGQTLVIKEKQP